MTNTRAREMLDGGYRMPSPDGAPEEMYQLMLRCWQYEPEDRPHFNEIHSSIDLLYSRYVEDFYNLNPIYYFQYMFTRILRFVTLSLTIHFH